MTQLKQKSVQLRKIEVNLKSDNKELEKKIALLSDEVNILSREKDLQERKSKSLILLVTDLQRQYD